ncbi:hypothetical protein FisN_14Lh228 [Fistulifera solaris]|uniref:Uncharacterized protein n=1 Tax=Fistulifera solaris TaxID=1519565 RepID=A0A1Z5J9Z3_FISSO|nr:hypothetical protein FisN_14Lh228 [Fistulifera solaris]|eukprot:GAX10712.1 hypothetical protein FisN_14Lh228 [Fistulifera solaris]
MSDPPVPRKSLVDYSKVADRPAQDARFAAQQRPTTTAVPPPSAQMDAVMRLMTGREERTIAEKLADANRPTWEQYKKDNHDKLNLDETNQQEMDLYRRKLDEQRDRLLARKPVKKKKKKKGKRRKEDESASDESSSEQSSERSGDHKRHSKKKHKRKQRKRKRKHRDGSSSDSESEDSSRRHRKKDHRHKSKSNDSDGDHYKLSQFFSEGTENNS